MNLQLKDLKKESNKVLCLIEDIIFDDLVELMSNKNENSMDEFTKSLIRSVKDNSVKIAILCYTDNGKELTEDDLVDIPLKIKVLNECLTPIMEILMDSMDKEASTNTDVKKKKVTLTKS